MLLPQIIPFIILLHISGDVVDSDRSFNSSFSDVQFNHARQLATIAVNPPFVSGNSNLDNLPMVIGSSVIDNPLVVSGVPDGPTEESFIIAEPPVVSGGDHPIGEPQPIPSGLRPQFLCPICPRGFNKQEHVQVHLRSSHNIQIESASSGSVPAVAPGSDVPACSFWSYHSFLDYQAAFVANWAKP